MVHCVGHIGVGFLRVKWPNQQCQSNDMGMTWWSLKRN